MLDLAAADRGRGEGKSTKMSQGFKIPIAEGINTE